jgi:hypothetical protein
VTRKRDDPYGDVKTYHFAKMIREDGMVSPLCADRPRALNLKRDSWTNRAEAVTCAKCRKRLKQQQEAAMADDTNMGAVEQDAPEIQELDCTKLIEREGWDCATCGHRHAGRTLANICIGCPCPETAPQNDADEASAVQEASTRETVQKLDSGGEE